MKYVLLTLLMAVGMQSGADINKVYLNPPNVEAINDHLHIHKWTPVYDKPYLAIRWMGEDQADITPTWEVSQLTGVNTSGDLHKTTVGSFNGFLWQGYNAYQMQGSEVGIVINSWTFPYQEVKGGGPHAIWSYQWEPNLSAPRPWSLNSTSDLTIQAKVKMPHSAFWGDSVAQISFVVYGLDVSKPKPEPLAILVNLYDNRGPDVYHVGNDGSPFLSTVMEDNQVLTKSFWSEGHQSRSWNDWKFFRAHITRNNLESIANALNFDAGFEYMSTNAEDYIVTSYHILVEVFTSEVSEVSIGVGLKDMMMLSCNNGEC